MHGERQRYYYTRPYCIDRSEDRIGPAVDAGLLVLEAGGGFLPMGVIASIHATES